MNKYWKYELFPKFLESIRDCTFVAMEDIDLSNTLNEITRMALNDFLFPKCGLEYEYDSTRDREDQLDYGYYFTDPNIGDAEFHVIISFMKVYWVRAQITWDNNFKNPFFDKDIKGYSPANMLNAMNKTLDTFLRDAEQARFNYNRKTDKGQVTWGIINAKK